MQVRNDGRAPSELRDIHLEEDVLPKSNGSVKFNMGNTSVIASLVGPLPVPRNGGTVISVSGPPNVDASRISVLLERSLEAAVIAYPGLYVEVSIVVVEDHGSVLSTCFNALAVVLASSGIPLRGVMTAVTLAVDEGSCLLMDPNSVEESESEYMVTLGYLYQKETGALLMFSESTGYTSEEGFQLCMSAGSTAAEFIRSIVKRSLSDTVAAKLN